MSMFSVITITILFNCSWRAVCFFYSSIHSFIHSLFFFQATIIVTTQTHDQLRNKLPLIECLDVVCRRIGGEERICFSRDSIRTNELHDRSFLASSQGMSHIRIDVSTVNKILLSIPFSSHSPMKRKKFINAVHVSLSFCLSAVPDDFAFDFISID